MLSNGFGVGNFCFSVDSKCMWPMDRAEPFRAKRLYLRPGNDYEEVQIYYRLRTIQAM